MGEEENSRGNNPAYLMIEPSFLNALRKICLRLDRCESIWVITGSLGMALQGMEIEVHDIDIQSDQDGAYEIEGLLSEYVVKPVCYLPSERIRSHLGALVVDGVKVEIIGDMRKLIDDQNWEASIQLEQHRRWVSFEEIQVPVLSLEYEHEAYLRLGRFEKAQKIKNWLENNNS